MGLPQRPDTSIRCRSASTIQARTIHTGLSVACVLLAACSNSREVSTPAGSDQPATAAEERWDAIYLGGVHVGHRHTQQTVKGDERHIRSKQQIRIDRDGQTVEMSVTLESWIGADQRPKRFRAETRMGGSPIIIEGRMAGDTVQLSTTTTSTTESQIPWSAEHHGFFGLERNLTDSVPKPGDQRQLLALVPLADRVLAVQHTITAEAWESVKGSDERWLRLRVKADVGGQPIESLVWIDRHGKPMKTENPVMQLVERATTREEAQASTAARLDLFELASVKLDRALPLLNNDRLQFEATVEQGSISELIHQGPNQTVQVLNQRTARITTLAQADASFVGQLPTSADLAASSLIQTDDAMIQQQAQQLETAATEGREIAVALERWVHEAVVGKNYAQGFASAAEVLREREGDCTEHAVLLAALARARGLPARLVTGLIYVPTRKAFVFHMWNEV